MERYRFNKLQQNTNNVELRNIKFSYNTLKTIINKSMFQYYQSQIDNNSKTVKIDGH